MAVIQNILKSIILFIVAVKMVRAQGNLFTALTDVEDLLETHKRIIDDLENYIHKEEERQNLLKTHLNIYKSELDVAMADVPNYIGNPINAFGLIRRLTTGLDYIKSNIVLGTDYIHLVTLSHLNLTLSYPNDNDLLGAAMALSRLQYTYQLTAEELAEGKLNGVLYSTPMSAGDCLEVGRALYNEYDFANAIAWLNVSLRKYRQEKIYFLYTEVEIMEYIAYIYYLSNDIKRANKWYLKILKKDPLHPRAHEHLEHFQKFNKQELANKTTPRWPPPVEADQRLPNPASDKNNRDSEYWTIFLELCRGELEISSEVSKRLHCRYLTENHPFLRLAPFKIEYNYRDPDIIVFYDVMSDDEIEHLKEMARPRLECTETKHPKTGKVVPVPFRTSKAGWLHDMESDIVEKISQRVQHMTTLSTDTAEELQIVNYGVGGHYAPHYDFKVKDECTFPTVNGNRIATVLFYMSNVDQGGTTVFTDLGVSIPPIKGTAVFWMNLHPSGAPDYATGHASCPVLRGSKWIATKWLHQGGQELIAPCSLEERTVRKIPLPVPKTLR